MFIYSTENFPFNYILQHFSPFYICCIAISLFTVVFTWYFNDNANVINFHPKQTRKRVESSSESDEYQPEDESLNVLSQLKRVERKAIEKILREELTEEQLAEEREAEERQLSEIFELLKKQEDKFHINSEEELQEQFKLYRSQ
ncbi:hypothetical protein J437_LFUL015768 [Ladona fulva]|uniref:Matrix-remodeling-associated protein 7 helical domain-containing protein n=1 Tax=Ladona fulva TaxID=123851 RepID=A0A8K0KK82_LADFU|nr:hypothetical protein J437_LFUL015768 [Ladona fulva]